MSARFTMVSLLVVITAACRGKDAPVQDTGAAIPGGNVATASDTQGIAANDTGCVKAGDWTQCNLMDRLESAGLAPRLTSGTIRQPFMSIPGVVISIGNTELQAYFYSDTLAVQRDFAKLDTVRVAPPTMQINWRATPNLIRSNNLMAILLSNDETQIERVRNAITAGLPARSPTP